MVVGGIERLDLWEADIAAVIRVDGQSFHLHSGEVLAAREEGHVIASAREVAADDAARAADAEDGKF